MILLIVEDYLIYASDDNRFWLYSVISSYRYAFEI